MYELSEFESKRLDLIWKNLRHEQAFDVGLRFVSRITGIPTDCIDHTGTVSDTNILHVIPKLPDQPRYDPLEEHAKEYRARHNLE